MNRYDEIEIDLKDLLAELLTKWAYILLCCALVAALMLAYAFVKDNKLANIVPIEERIANAKEALSVEDAETVERVFQQYESYTQYKESLQKYYSDYLFIGDDFSNYIAEDVVYCMSTNVFGADDIIKCLSLTPEVYKEISSILPEDQAIATIYNRITLTSNVRESITLLNDDEDGVFLPNDYIFTLSIVAKTAEQCDNIEKIVTNSIKEQFSIVKDIDEGASLTIIGSNYNEDVAGWLMNRQTEAINQLNNIEYIINNFNNNQVNNLSDNQKSYYSSLISAQQEEKNAPKTSKLKYLIVGVLGGGLIACAYILLKYLFEPSIKTEDDISFRYNVPVLKTIAIEGKKHLLVDKIVRFLKNISSEDKEKALNITATDIGILMGKKKNKKLYIVKTVDSDDSQKTAEALKRLLERKDAGVSVLIGVPERESGDMSNLAESDSVVVLAETEKTLIRTLDKYCELFERFNSNVLGTVVLKKV